MKKKIIALLLAALVCLAAAGCQKKGTAEEAAPSLLATTQPVYQITCALTAGTGLGVELLISEPVSCLHDYTLSVSQMQRIEKASLILKSGLGLEDFMDSVLSGKEAVELSSGLLPLTGEEGEDPHWWLDPARMQLALKAACDALSARYPAQEDTFRTNCAAFEEKLSQLQAYGDEALSGLSCRELVTFHDGFSYFADAFDLTIAAAMEIESGSEPSAKELEAIVSLVRAQAIPAVFTETNGESGTAAVIAGETGCKTCTLDMAISAEDYFSAMRENIDIVKEALA